MSPRRDGAAAPTRMTGVIMPVVTDERWKYEQLSRLVQWVEELHVAMSNGNLTGQRRAAHMVFNVARRIERAASK